MTLSLYYLLLPSLLYLSLFLFVFKLIMPYIYLYSYHYSQSMLNKYYFYKRSLHSFLSHLSNYTTMAGSPPPPPPVVSKCGLGLIIANDFNPNVIESSSSLPQQLNPKPMPLSPKKKVDLGGIGFIDDMGGGVDGLTSCTESLGFESCNERRSLDDDDEYVEFCEEETRYKWRSIRKRIEEKRSSEIEEKKYPPPISSLNQNGQPRFYLRPVRQNGRLELTEIKIDRSEVLHAVRENGRLTLHLVTTDNSSTLNQEEEEEEEEDEEIKQEVHGLQREEEEEEEEEEMKVGRLWNYRVNGGEGSRRCHEIVNYHHHDHHVWRQPCVSTR